MAVFTRRGREAEDNAVLATGPSRGGGFANLTALIAILLSGYSFYETVLKVDELRLFTPPTIAFSDPANGPFDVFVIPVTVANVGARAGVALSFDLDVTDPRSGQTKRYYAAGFGGWRKASQGEFAPFAPVSVAGREAETREILFYPRAEETIERPIAQEGGDYRFALTMRRAPVDRLPAFLQGEDAPVTLTVDMTIGELDYRNFTGGGTMTLRRPDYAPAVSE